MKEIKQTEIEKNKMRQPKTWEEIESPNFFRFEKIGDIIEGLLMSKESSSRYGFGLYTIKTFDGLQRRFHGSSQLDDLLLNIDIPCYVQIEYTDNQETANGTMKLFIVKKGKN
jgi:hypothetical protein